MNKSRFLIIQVVIAAIVVLIMVGWVIRNVREYGPKPDKRQVVRVMTYGSFMLPSGPGPLLKKEFETLCDCIIEYVDGGDSALFLEKLIQFPERKVDLVLGLSVAHTFKARTEFSWRNMQWPEGVEWNKGIPPPERFKVNGMAKMLPFSWAPMTFIYRKGEIEPPKSWSDLSKSVYADSLSVPDPRYAVSGIHLVTWVFSGSQREELSQERMKALSHSLMSIAPSWSASYGMFRKKSAKLTFSYGTSPVYHWQEEKDFSYQPAVFKEGHPVEVEWAAIPKDCDACLKAEEFVHYLLRPSSQKILMERNYMFPVVAGVVGDSLFSQLPKLPLMDFEQMRVFIRHKDNLPQAFVDQLKDYVQ